MKKQAKAPVCQSDDPLIKPTSDLFTAILWSAPKNEPLLRDFINAVLIDRRLPTILEATVLNRFNIKEFALDRQQILDVRVRNEWGGQYNIEVQTAPHLHFCDRMLFQWADVYSAQLRTGNNFALLRPVKSIVLTDFPIFPNLQDLHTVFEIRANENSEVLLTEHFQMHFLRLGDMRKRQLEGFDVLYRGLQHWLNFFLFGSTVTEEKMSKLAEKNPAVMAAYQEFKRFTMNDDMQDLERRRRRFREDWQIGINAGKEEGKAEGKAERDIEIARNMKRKGYDLGAIAELTGLSLAEIKRLD